MKPALSELFAAMNGVILAGVTAVKNDESTSHPLADLSVRAAKLAYDMRTRLLQSAFSMPALQDNIAKTCLSFLTDPANRKILEDHKSGILTEVPSGKTGGTVHDVGLHIDEMAMREAAFPAARKVETLNGSGGLSRAFPADYLPSQQRPARSEATAPAPATYTAPVPKPTAQPVHALI